MQLDSIGKFERGEKKEREEEERVEVQRWKKVDTGKRYGRVKDRPGKVRMQMDRRKYAGQ